MNLSKLLTSLGLSENEACIYMTLLKNGTKTISGIAQESGMHRPAIYAALPKLKDHGLISQRHVGKLIHYAAEPPERLRSLLDSVHGELDTVIPQLEGLQSKHTPIVRRLDGRAGIHAVFEDIVNTCKKGEIFYRYSSEGVDEMRKIGLPKDYAKKRDAKELERLVITNPEFMRSREPKLEEYLKVVPKEFLPFHYDVAQIIYGDKVAFIDYSQPTATIIENPYIAQFQKDIFKMLFHKL